MLTLGSGVSPETPHSLMSAGATIEVEFAASTKLTWVTHKPLSKGHRQGTYGSLMMLTQNSFVALIFSRVSFGLLLGSVHETIMSGGLCETSTTSARQYP